MRQTSSILASVVGPEPIVPNTYQSLTLRGTIAALNTAIDTLTYFSDAHFNTEFILETITVTANDLGNADHRTDGDTNNGTSTFPEGSDAGVGSRLLDMETFGVTILPINDGPTINVAGVNTTVEEDASTGLQFAGLRVLEDQDDPYDPNDVLVQVTLSVLHGGLTINSTTTGVTLLSSTAAMNGPDTDEPLQPGTFQAMTLRGTIPAFTAALDTLVYYNDAHFNTEAN
ncbi:MAG: hypothetical protein HYV60_20350, partial [Planctomycetia bacterium]|nr:hypothetical protein [Planctomycetia bacterium]